MSLPLEPGFGRYPDNRLVNCPNIAGIGWFIVISQQARNILFRPASRSKCGYETHALRITRRRNCWGPTSRLTPPQRKPVKWSPHAITAAPAICRTTRDETISRAPTLTEPWRAPHSRCRRRKLSTWLATWRVWSNDPKPLFALLLTATLCCGCCCRANARG